MSYNNNKKTGLRYPAINDMIAKAENKYELVLATSKRAREIVSGSDPLVKIDIDNPISIATKEIYEDAVKIVSENQKVEVPEEVFPEDVNDQAPTTAELAEESDVADVIMDMETN